jgi:putative oxidoreductase
MKPSEGSGKEGDMSVGRLGARLLIGGLFIGHGTQKIFGWFGGPGRAGTEAMMEHIDMRPAKVHALLAGTTETVGGTLLAAGLATPLASAALTGVMTTAIRKVHLPNGPWAANGGWEYNAVLIGAVTALAETGPGELSLDHLLHTERSGPLWALASLATGVGTAFLTMAAGGRSRPTLTDAPTPAVAPPKDDGGRRRPRDSGDVKDGPVR